MVGQKWGCDFLKDLIIKIAEKHLDSYDDFEKLRWICSDWRKAAKEAIFEHPSHPLLILPFHGNNYTCKNLHLYSLSTRVIRYIDIPEDIIDRYRRVKVLSSSKGWILLLAELKDRTTDLFLFNPFSAAVIKLPTFDSDDSVTENIRKFVLSANPCTTYAFSVYIMFAPEAEVPTSSFFWRKGDHSWTRVDTDYCDVARLITYYEGSFYKIGRHGTVNKVDSITGQTLEMCKLSAEEFLSFGRDLLYLVELDGQLVVIKRVRQKVVRKMRTVRLMRTVRFELFELDLTNEKVERMQFPSLGNAAVFIDSTDSFSLQNAPSVRVCGGFNVKPNCIYYTDDRYDPRDPNITGLYNLSNGEIEYFYNGPSITGHELTFEESTSHFAQLMWVQCHPSRY